MALTEQMEAALNDQITCELAASLTYLQMAAHFEADDRPGMAAWMSSQSAEELAHAQMFIDFVLDRDGRIEIGAIPSPVSKFDSPLHVFEEALRSEQHVSNRIRDLYRLANELGDLDSLPFLHTFLNEQIEEESTIGTICERLRRIGQSEIGLALIEQELGSRQAETV